MKVKILETARWAKHPAWGPIVDIVEGELYVDDDEVFCQRLIDNEYAVLVEEEEEDEWGEFTEEDPPWDHPAWDNKHKNAKNILEQFALQFYDVDIDKRKSVNDLIEFVKGLDI